MTYEEFLEARFYIPEAEYNDLVNWSNVPLSLVNISTRYSLYSTIRFYEYIFDLFLLDTIRLYNIESSTSHTKYNFLFFKLDSQFDIFPEEAKTKIVEKYYSLLSIYNKYYIDKVKEKSPFNYYQEEILKIEPNFTRKNINKLIQEFGDFDLTDNFYNSKIRGHSYFSIIYNLFQGFVRSSEYDIFMVNCAKEYLNKREYPKNLKSWLLNINLSEGYVNTYLNRNPNFKERVLKIYNKFIYWFELDRSFTI